MEVENLSSMSVVETERLPLSHDAADNCPINIRSMRRSLSEKGTSSLRPLKVYSRTTGNAYGETIGLSMRQTPNKRMNTDPQQQRCAPLLWAGYARR